MAAYHGKNDLMDISLPETPREINKAKAQLFRHQSEFIRAKDDVNSVEREWLAWSVGRISELENEA